MQLCMPIEVMKDVIMLHKVYTFTYQCMRCTDVPYISNVEKHVVQKFQAWQFLWMRYFEIYFSRIGMVCTLLHALALDQNGRGHIQKNKLALLPRSVKTVKSNTLEKFLLYITYPYNFSNSIVSLLQNSDSIR